MAFLDKEIAFQRRQELERQAEIESARVATETQDVAQRLLDEEKSHATEDNKAIIALLDSLPEMNLQEYLRVVARHTGHAARLVLYTRLALYPSDERERLLKQDQELNDKLSGKGISLWVQVPRNEYDGDPEKISAYFPPSMLHPEKEFCGDDIHPNNWFSSITEPQEPGIGIHFNRMVRQSEQQLNFSQGMKITTYSSVYVRLVTPATALITGSGERAEFTSLEAFDQALERGFKNKHEKTIRVPYNYRVSGHG